MITNTLHDALSMISSPRKFNSRAHPESGARFVAPTHSSRLRFRHRTDSYVARIRGSVRHSGWQLTPWQRISGSIGCGMLLASWLTFTWLGSSSEGIPVTRTLGAAIGALIMMMFMAHIATRLMTPASAASSATSPLADPRR